MKITSSDMIAFTIAMLAAITITTFIFSVQRVKSVNDSLDRCQMICRMADAEVHALKIQKRILVEQLRQIKALIPTNVTVKVEMSNIIEDVDNEPCEGCRRLGITK